MKNIKSYNDKNQKHGYWEYYYGGKLWYKGNYVNGQRDGYWEEYHFNGNQFFKGHYVNGLRDGYWEWYYSNGNLKSKQFFI